MTKIETHTQANGDVIVTARLGTRVMRVYGPRHRRAYIELSKAIAHAKSFNEIDAADDGLRAHVLARDDVPTVAPVLPPIPQDFATRATSRRTRDVGS